VPISIDLFDILKVIYGAIHTGKRDRLWIIEKILSFFGAQALNCVVAVLDLLWKLNPPTLSSPNTTGYFLCQRLASLIIVSGKHNLLAPLQPVTLLPDVGKFIILLWRYPIMTNLGRCPIWA
jgi:hypothetical protein